MHKTVKITLAHGSDSRYYPTKASALAVGYDLKACIKAPITLPPVAQGQRVVIPCGICLQLPEGVEAQIRSRSGLAYDHGIIVANSPGTIDPDYRGEIKVILANIGLHKYVIYPGDRIAQMVFSQYYTPIFEKVDSLDETARGPAGFGSTGY